MRSEKSVVTARRLKIRELIEKKGSVKVSELAQLFHTTPLTIRRDLDEMQNQGILTRFYGGASLLEQLQDENMFSSTLELHKHAIAKEAAAMVEDGDTIFINTSSTALLVMRYITARQVTVITNNGKAIFADRNASDMLVVLTGGELRFPKESMVGDVALNSLSRVTASKCFIGCAGLTPEEGITTGVLQESAINEIMLKRTTGPRVVVADCQKIGRHHAFISADTDAFDTLITDTEADSSVLAALRGKNIRIICVSPPKRLPSGGWNSFSRR